MSESSPTSPGRADLALRVVDRIEETVLGQRGPAEALLAAYMAGGHVLLEGAPGVFSTSTDRVCCWLIGRPCPTRARGRARS